MMFIECKQDCDFPHSGKTVWVNVPKIIAIEDAGSRWCKIHTVDGKSYAVNVFHKELMEKLCKV